MPDAVLGDLHAQIAALRTGERRLLEIYAKFGRPTVLAAIERIIADGEAIGAVLLLSREQGARMGDTEMKVAETAAGIVGRQMEQ